MAEVTEDDFLLACRAASAEGGESHVTDEYSNDQGVVALVIEIRGRSARCATQFWLIKCLDSYGTYRVAELPARIVEARFSNDHPLLLARATAQHELFFADTPADPDKAIAELLEAHREVARDWVIPWVFLNARTRQELSSTFALLSR